MQFASQSGLLGLARRLLPLLLFMAACVCAQAQEVPLMRQVKAAYLYKFAGFVEWPEGSFVRPDSPLVIGVMGADALAEQLEQTVAGHSANGHPLQVKKLKKNEAPGNVHILFLGALDKASLQDVIAATRNQPLLTVSDNEEAHALGSIVNFVLADDRLRFEVALKPASLARIRISARMLSAAVKVQGGAT
ncbi:YfiR family protein [Pseudoduganella sp. LjRoot289]|uniref:YfiR family protein n=1 Tax=Pseudoduganella sp. LjRoot289 TaxID=3342314 RepID=UPI003ECFF05F